MSETKLLACPFCGGGAQVRTVDGWCRVVCDMPKCEASSFPFDECPADAKANWNRRADTELVEALREALFFAEVDLRASLAIVEAIKGEGTALGLRQTIERVEKANAILRKREG